MADRVYKKPTGPKKESDLLKITVKAIEALGVEITEDQKNKLPSEVKRMYWAWHKKNWQDEQDELPPKEMVPIIALPPPDGEGEVKVVEPDMEGGKSYAAAVAGIVKVKTVHHDGKKKTTEFMEVHVDHLAAAKAAAAENE